MNPLAPYSSADERTLNEIVSLENDENLEKISIAESKQFGNSKKNFCLNISLEIKEASTIIQMRQMEH